MVQDGPRISPPKFHNGSVRQSDTGGYFTPTHPHPHGPCPTLLFSTMGLPVSQNLQNTQKSPCSWCAIRRILAFQGPNASKNFWSFLFLILERNFCHKKCSYWWVETICKKNFFGRTPKKAPRGVFWRFSTNFWQIFINLSFFRSLVGLTTKVLSQKRLIFMSWNFF